MINRNTDYKIKEVKMVITLKTGKVLAGNINIEDYKRTSDYIEDHKKRHLKFYNVRVDGAIAYSPKKFLLIPKDSIDYYEPYDG